MVCIRLCHTCGQSHIVGSPCPIPMTMEEMSKSTQELLDHLRAAESTIPHREMHFGMKQERIPLELQEGVRKRLDSGEVMSIMDVGEDDRIICVYCGKTFKEDTYD